jgi:tryptophan synthase alpha chain
VLADAAGAKRLSLVPFTTAGFPDSRRSLDLLRALDEGGADALELGVPFSDPLADGPTIQRTSQIALDGGTTLRSVLELVRRFREGSATPIVLMSYANPIHAYGIARFATDAVEAGVEGVLVTDLPPDERPEDWQALTEAGLARIQLVAPTTAASRLDTVTAAATGFVYCVSRTGVTGKGRRFADNLADQMARVRATTSLPLLVGFGVREPQDVRALAPHADGVVVGAAVLEEVLDASDPDLGCRRAGELVARLAAALDKDPGTRPHRPRTPDPKDPPP